MGGEGARHSRGCAEGGWRERGEGSWLAWAMRPIFYLLLGGVGGAALAENKELVGDYLYDAGAFLKSFIKHLETVELSGKALKDTPVIQDVLAAVSNATLHRQDLQDRVDQASNAVRTIVSKRAPTDAETPAPLSRAFIGVKSVLGLSMAASAAYICYEPKARKLAMEYISLYVSHAQVQMIKTKEMMQEKYLHGAVCGHVKMRSVQLRKKLEELRRRFDESGLAEKAQQLLQQGILLANVQAHKAKLYLHDFIQQANAPPAQTSL